MSDRGSESEVDTNDDEFVWSFDPFDRSGIRLAPKELNSPFSYVAVHGTPTDTVYEGRLLMYWELVCVYIDAKGAAPMKTVTFAVKSRPAEIWYEPYIHVYGGVNNVDSTVDSENFWWWWPLSNKILGSIASFQRIIDFLEKEQNRYEKNYVNGETLEGTFLWVKEIIRLLEEGDVVQSPWAALGVGMGELGGVSMVASDLISHEMEWMTQYGDIYYSL